MIDLVWLTTASNLCLAGLLAIVAFTAGKLARAPRVAHGLWVLVLLKLITPPVFGVQHWFSYEQPTSRTEYAAAAPIQGELTTHSVEVVDSNASGQTLGTSPADMWERVRYRAVAAWIAGTLFLLFQSVRRYRRFAKLLADSRHVPPEFVEQLLSEVSCLLGARRAPRLLVTSARVSPMLLPSAPRGTVVVPSSLLEQLSHRELRWILAHEVAHFRRGDHYVRMLEWLARTVFWWNPLVWIAGRQLREAEEVCCDALVLAQLGGRPRSYAAAILRAVEAITPPAHRPPAVASAMDSGGSLDKRVKMMVSQSRLLGTSKWTKAVVTAVAIAVLPLGVVSAQDYARVYKRLQRSVSKGEITAEQADVMMIALKESDEDHDHEEDRDDFASRLKKAVADGEISEEEAWEQWRERRHHGDYDHEEEGLQHGDEEEEHEWHHDDDDEDEDDEHEWHDDERDEEDEEFFENIRRQLVWAIRTGKVSPERLEEEWDDIIEEAEEDEDHGHGEEEHDDHDHDHDHEHEHEHDDEDHDHDEDHEHDHHGE